MPLNKGDLIKMLLDGLLPNEWVHPFPIARTRGWVVVGVYLNVTG